MKDQQDDTPRDETQERGGPATRAQRVTVSRLLPLAIIIGGLVAVFAFGLDDYVSFEKLKEHRDALMAWKDSLGLWAPLLFTVAYAAMVAFSIPGGLPATIAGGFLFGLYVASITVTLGATLGAVAIFLATRTALGEPLRQKAGPAIRRMQDGFKRNALSYMLILRLVPVFPFWLINLVPAFLGVPLWIYTFGTLIGIIPGVVVYASLGAGLDEVIRAGGEPGLDMLLQPTFLIATIGLIVLALLPIVYKRFARRRPGEND